jgi:hypothetical protein
VGSHTFSRSPLRWPLRWNSARSSRRRRCTTALVITLSAISLSVAGVTAANAAAGTDRLSRNEWLQPDQSLWSTNGQYRLIEQGDGNLVAYQGSGVLWASNTAGHPGARTVMQGDGNLVVYAANGAALFATHTEGTPADTLIMQNDGNLVIYGGGRAIWDRHSGRLAEGSASQGGSGPQAFDQRRAADIGRTELGTRRATGFNQPGECIKSVQRWIAAAGGRMAGGGPVSAYRNSPATLVATGSGLVSSAAKGDVIQYTSTGSPDSYLSGVHTVMVVANNGNGTLWIVQSNVPFGSGLVSEVRSWKPAPPAGFVAYLWRFGRIV